MSETQPDTFDGDTPGSRHSVTGTAEQPPPGITAWPEREKPAQPREATADEVIADWHAGLCPRDPYDDIGTLVAEVKRLRDEAEYWHAVATKAKDQRDQAERQRDEARHLHNQALIQLDAMCVHRDEAFTKADEFRSELSRTEGDLAVAVAEASRNREALREMRTFVPLIQKASVRKARDRFASAALRLVDAALRGSADREGVC